MSIYRERVRRRRKGKGRGERTCEPQPVCVDGHIGKGEYRGNKDTKKDNQQHNQPFEEARGTGAVRASFTLESETKTKKRPVST
jgi:hypothetical protein